MVIQLKPLCVSIIHINRWRHIHLKAWLEHASRYINLNSRPTVKQSLTIAVTTGPKNARIQVVSVTVNVADLLARGTDRPNGTDGIFHLNEYLLN